MFKKTAIAALGVIAALCFTVPAAAETFTSANGVFSIDLPSENWKQIEDPAKWIALTDGGSVITVDHFSNGEKLPEMSVADNHYVNVFQAVYSTQNEVFVITGSVVDPAKIPEITSSIVSAKVLKYDTKLAVGKEISTTEFSVVPMDKTMYVTAEWLNVRMGCSVDEQVIGGFGYGSKVKVLGSVQRTGKDLGWYMVSYESGTGYVSASFLSDTEPAAKEEEKNSSDTSYTGSVKTVYDENGDSYTLYEGTDGFWYEKDGTKYTRRSDTEFQVWEGNSILTTYNQAYDDGYDYSDQEGEAEYIYCYYCGEWYHEGNEFRNHVCPDRDAAIAAGTYDDPEDNYNTGDGDDYDYSDQEGEAEYIYCYYCGEWYHEGEEFDNHYCPDRDAAMEED